VADSKLTVNSFRVAGERYAIDYFVYDYEWRLIWKGDIKLNLLHLLNCWNNATFRAFTSRPSDEASSLVLTSVKDSDNNCILFILNLYFLHLYIDNRSRQKGRSHSFYPLPLFSTVFFGNLWKSLEKENWRHAINSNGIISIVCVWVLVAGRPTRSWVQLLNQLIQLAVVNRPFSHWVGVLQCRCVGKEKKDSFETLTVYIWDAWRYFWDSLGFFQGT